MSRAPKTWRVVLRQANAHALKKRLRNFPADRKSMALAILEDDLTRDPSQNAIFVEGTARSWRIRFDVDWRIIYAVFPESKTVVVWSIRRKHGRTYKGKPRRFNR